MKKLIPHIEFPGNCLEAINHYVHVFKGEIEALDKYKDQPVSVPKDWENKIYFCHFKFEGGEFYASDKESASTSSFWVQCESEAEILEIAKKLFDRKEISITKSVFGESMFRERDSFGIEWNLILR
ncbi:MAG: VOC family protein [Crocinitomicaceae bacterium]|nr:VOC family protein [Crocinitomicaceae bacterium]